MDIKKIKELEDLKAELRAKYEKYNQMIDERKSKYINDAQKEFKDFFKSQGFNINENYNEIQAEYGNAKIIMEKVNVNEEFIGAYSAWGLKCLTDKSEYEIRVNTLGNYPRITMTVDTSYGNVDETEEKKMDKDIEKAKEELQNVKIKIEQFESVEWAYGLVKSGGRNGLKYPQFKTMRELLESLFE